MSARTIRIATALLLLAPPVLARHEGEVHLPSHFELLEVAGPWARPVGLVFDGSGRLFVAQKYGQVFVHDGTTAQSTPFVDLDAEVNSFADRGLLGIALHPGFVPDGGATSWVYLLYTESPILGQNLPYDYQGQYSWSVLERMHAVTNGQNEIVADLSSREVLLGERLADGTAPTAIASLDDSHSPGTLLFADDGTLLVSAGDGAAYTGLDPGGNHAGGFDDVVNPSTGLKGPTPKVQDSGAFRAQDLRSLSGKILRIDPATGLGLPSNPFYDGDPASNASRVWALGLRNPYRLAHLAGSGSSDPSLGDPGLLVCGDVGSNIFEELNLVDAPGLNFQWPCAEGPDPQPLYSIFNRQPPNPLGYLDCGDPKAGTLRAPLLAWSRSNPNALFPPATPSYDQDGNANAGFGGSASVGGEFYLGGGAYPASYDGLFFFADYGYDWIRTIGLDASHAVTEVREFAHGFDNVVDLARHPVSGELYVVQLLDGDGTPGHLWRLRHGTNGSPEVVVHADSVPGPAPLLVTLDASGSSDPDDDALTFTYDFGDGSAPLTTTLDVVQHTYTSDGVFTAEVTAEDPLGLSRTEEVTVLVGVTAPLVEITSPFQGHTVATPSDVLLTGSGTDLDGPNPVALTWDVTLHHNTHAHPNAGAGSGPTFVAQIADHGDSGDLIFHEVALRGTTVAGATSVARLWIYDEDQVVDVTGTATFTSSLDTLVPPVPQGGGNTDTEVLRDTVTTGGAAPLLAQFDTEHGGDQGDLDHLGWTLVDAPGPYDRFVGMDLTSGVVDAAGGWFETITVEVSDGDAWEEVSDLAIDPPYPTGPTAPLGSDFTTYHLRFAPVAGVGVRVRGVPGGTVGYVSAAELRVLALRPNPVGETRDATLEGSITARILELSPPTSLGNGAPDLEVIRDGTEPAVGSASQLAQYASLHGGDQAGDDWYGYVFDRPYVFSAMHFREGLHFQDGGWFESLTVETRFRDTDAWVPVNNLAVSPPLRGTGIGTLSYEPFDLTFDPRVGRQIRLRGVPGGTNAYTTVAELRAIVRAGPPDLCPIEAYGTGYPGNTLELATACPARLGLPGALQVAGCSPSTAVVVGLSGAPADLDLGLGQHLLVDPSVNFQLFIVAADPAGEAFFTYSVPPTPTLAGVQLYFQAAALVPASTLLDLSNGLHLGVCP
ncbi:MAG: PQQ-dependent sugar dehydrogenase [Planctomycetota bacterium]